MFAFTGRTFGIRNLSTNRYEYRNAYSVQYGTATELMRWLSEQQSAAQLNAIELTHAKQQLREAVAQQGVSLESITVCSTPPTASPPPESPPACAAPNAVAAQPHVEVVAVTPDDRQPRTRRPNGKSYLLSLRKAEAEQKSG